MIKQKLRTAIETTQKASLFIATSQLDSAAVSLDQSYFISRKAQQEKKMIMPVIVFVMHTTVNSFIRLTS